jgi:hypothetical protein
MLSPMPSNLQHHHPHANGLLATPPTPTLVTAPPLFTGPTSATGGAFTGFCIPTTTLAAASSLFAAAAAHQHQQPNAFEGVPIFLVPSSQHNNNHAGSLAALAALKAAVRVCLCTIIGIWVLDGSNGCECRNCMVAYNRLFSIRKQCI